MAKKRKRYPKRKLSPQKKRELAKKLWPSQITEPTRKEMGEIRRNLFFDHGYSDEDARDFYEDFILNRVRDKQEEISDDEIFRRKRPRISSIPDAEFPSNEEAVDVYRDERLALRDAKEKRNRELQPIIDRQNEEYKRNEPPSFFTQLGDDVLKVLRYERPTEGEFNKGGVVKRKKKKSSAPKKTYSRGSRKAKYNG